MLGIVINRVLRAEQASTELQEETRHKRAIARRKLKEEFEAAEELDKPLYASGLY